MDWNVCKAFHYSGKTYTSWQMNQYFWEMSMYMSASFCNGVIRDVHMMTSSNGNIFRVTGQGSRMRIFDVSVLIWLSLRWRHNGRDSVSNHQPHNCLLNRLFRRRSKKTSKITGLCVGNSPGPVNRDRWIPRTKGQLRGKCFHLMTSSCIGPSMPHNTRG